MIQKFSVKFSAISSHLYNCHYQSGINTVTISNDSLIEGYFVFFRGIYIYTPLLLRSMTSCSVSLVFDC